jgi:uncharacterized RDD family membrane protein YckC
MQGFVSNPGAYSMTIRTCPSCGAPDYGTPYCVSCQKPFSRPGTAAPSTSGGSADLSLEIRPAGFIRRFMALLVDWLIFSITGNVILLAYRLGIGKENSVINMDTVMFVMAVTALLYFTLLTGDGGQTPGKKLLGIRVVRVDGTSVPYDKAFTRSLGYMLSVFFGTFLGFLWALWDRKKQAWHDKIAGTIVIRV